MKTLSILALAACTAVNYASAAPMGVIVISGPQFDKESSTDIDIDAVMNRFEAFAKSRFVPVTPGIVNTHVPVADDNDLSAHIPHFLPPPIKHHKPTAEWDGKKKVTCGQRKGGKMTVARKMRFLMNKLRAALGLPIVKYNHNHHQLQDAEVPPLPPHVAHFHGFDETEFEDIRSGFGQYANTGEPFIVRFTRAVNTLSPWESRAVTFVLGMGLGALIRMFVVFGILFVRGRKAGRFCERRRARRAARQAAREAAMNLATAPPSYNDAHAPIDEKRAVVDAPVEQTLRQKVAHLHTIEPSSNGLTVIWADANGNTNESPTADFHTQYPEKLLEFYELNLKFRPIEDEVAQV